jgi:hypothetical protein
VFSKNWAQNKDVKKLFYVRIEQKIKEQKQKRLDKIDEKLPMLLAMLVKPVVSMQFESEKYRHEAQGAGGEETISNTLWFWLPGNYRYFDDVVLEPEKDEFIQLDHIVIAPQGIFIVETKTWSGVIFATNDAWRLKVGNQWRRIENPLKQNENHVRLFKKWLNNNFRDEEFLQNVIYPVVVLKKTSWFKANESVRMPVKIGGLELVGYIKNIKGNFISDELGKEICEKIEFAEPYKENMPIEEGVNKYGKRFVRVRGSHEYALKIKEEYKNKGFQVDEVRQDIKNKEVYYFYFKNII